LKLPGEIVEQNFKKSFGSGDGFAGHGYRQNLSSAMRDQSNFRLP
jgi:hypothetical protein